MSVERKFRQAWDLLAQLTWMTRPQAIRALPVEQQRDWYRKRLQELAKQVRGG